MLKIPLTIPVILIGAVIAQGFFAAVVLILLKNNQKANRFLSGLVFCFSLWLCDTFFRVADIFQQNPGFYFLPIYCSLAFGPLMYFYTRAMTEKNFSFRKVHLWHFLPVLLQAGLYIFLQLKDYSFRRWFWLEVHRPYTYDLEFNLSLLSLLIYLFFSIRLVLKYRKWIENQYSEISRISLNWLRTVQGLLLVLTSLWLLDALLREFMTYFPNQPFSAIAMGLSILILAIGGLLQSDLIGKGLAEEKTEASTPSLTIEEMDPDLLKQITSKMETQQHYLNPDLTLDEFAATLHCPPRKVSFHINKGLGVPFIDFVNQYRVGKVKQHLQKNDLPHLTLLGIAMESGFNSKSTFNRVFKKMTGQSPSVFQKNIE